MAFTDAETSIFDNDPIELYQFKRNGTSFRYTSSDEDVIFQANTYTAASLKRGRIEATPDLGKNNLKIKTSRRLPFASQFLTSSPTDVIELTITRIHDSDADPAITWIGRVINVSFADNETEITAAPLSSSLKRPGLRRPYQLDCPHVLYESATCRVVQSLQAVTGNISAVSGNLITAPEFIISINALYDANHFVGGIVEFTTASLTDRRFITDHDNATGQLTLNLPYADLVIGSVVVAYPGCDRLVGTCNGKFANLVNHGGFPFIPTKNPMDGTSVF